MENIMHQYIKSSLIVAVSGLILLNSSASFANPCQGIAEACKKEGYFKGAPVGKRLIKDCVLPVAQNGKTVSYSASESEKAQCKALILQKMGNQ
jgi:hypothetical protein